MSVYLSGSVDTFTLAEEIHGQRGAYHGRKDPMGVGPEWPIKLDYPETLSLNADYGAHI